MKFDRDVPLKLRLLSSVSHKALLLASDKAIGDGQSAHNVMLRAGLEVGAITALQPGMPKRA